MSEEQQENHKEINKKGIVFLIFVLIFIGSIATVSLFNRNIQKANPPKIKINDSEFKIQIADSESERAQGLMNVETLPVDEGMIFVYPEEGYRTFWMKKYTNPARYDFYR